VWEALALSRPVISGDSPTVRQALTHKQHIYLVKRDDAQALATAILELRENSALREHIAKSGYQ
jgi:glycosyltransferase involved in cell wall biosynthesis